MSGWSGPRTRSAEALGGTWRDNSYPGPPCDVPSHLYCFSFAPNPGWSRSFSPQPEIWDYLQHVATDEGVSGHIRFGREVTAARWDPAGSLWRIQTPMCPATRYSYLTHSDASG